MRAALVEEPTREEFSHRRKPLCVRRLSVELCVSVVIHIVRGEGEEGGREGKGGRSTSEINATSIACVHACA